LPRRRPVPAAERSHLQTRAIVDKIFERVLGEIFGRFFGDHRPGR
jgi:hypothetical protein